MNKTALELLDSTAAENEGDSGEGADFVGHTIRRDQMPYEPARDPKEVLRLMEKYIHRVVRVENGWAAIGSNGRACVGSTLPIAICMAAVESQ